MDSIYAIAFGLGLRTLVDAVSQNLKLTGSLIGLWEGIITLHFLKKMPHSSDPYIAYGVRLFIDFLITENIGRLVLVLIWTAFGMVLADVTPAVWDEIGFRRVWRHFRRDLYTIYDKIPTVAFFPPQRTVRFLPPRQRQRQRQREQVITPSIATPQDTPITVIPPLSSVPSESLKHRVPGYYPEDYSDTDTDLGSISRSRPSPRTEVSDALGTTHYRLSTIPELNGTYSASDLDEGNQSSVVSSPSSDQRGIQNMEEEDQALVDVEEEQVLPDRATTPKQHIPMPPTPSDSAARWDIHRDVVEDAKPPRQELPDIPDSGETSDGWEKIQRRELDEDVSQPPTPPAKDRPVGAPNVPISIQIPPFPPIIPPVPPVTMSVDSRGANPFSDIDYSILDSFSTPHLPSAVTENRRESVPPPYTSHLDDSEDMYYNSPPKQPTDADVHANVNDNNDLIGDSDTNTGLMPNPWDVPTSSNVTAQTRADAAKEEAAKKQAEEAAEEEARIRQKEAAETERMREEEEKRKQAEEERMREQEEQKRQDVEKLKAQQAEETKAAEEERVRRGEEQKRQDVEKLKAQQAEEAKAAEEERVRREEEQKRQDVEKLKAQQVEEAYRAKEAELKRKAEIKKKEEDDDALRKQRQAAEKKKEEEAAKRQEEAEKKRKAEKRKEAEEAAKRQEEEERAAEKKKEEDAAAIKREEERKAAEKKEEDAAAIKREEEERKAAEKKREEGAAAKKKEEEIADQKKKDEDADALKRQQEEEDQKATDAEKQEAAEHAQKETKETKLKNEPTETAEMETEQAELDKHKVDAPGDQATQEKDDDSKTLHGVETSEAQPQHEQAETSNAQKSTTSPPGDLMEEESVVSTATADTPQQANVRLGRMMVLRAQMVELEKRLDELKSRGSDERSPDVKAIEKSLRKFQRQADRRYAAGMSSFEFSGVSWLTSFEKVFSSQKISMIMKMMPFLWKDCILRPPKENSKKNSKNFSPQLHARSFLR
jgi:hypothetical protein